MPVPTVVLDANVIISGLAFFGAPRKCIDLAIGGSVSLVTSQRILQDVRDKLIHKLGFSPGHATSAVEMVSMVARLIDVPGDLRGVCRDPDDDIVIECAVVGMAEYLVTGDRDLLDIGQYRSVQVVTPASFIAVLSEDAT